MFGLDGVLHSPAMAFGLMEGVVNKEGGDRMLAFKFGKRREILAKHLYIARDKGPLNV